MDQHERTTLEQNLHSIAIQKQAMQQQAMEAELALKELLQAKTAYKILGNIMIQTPVEQLRQDLEKKREIAHARLAIIEKQEEKLNTKLHERDHRSDQGSA